MKKILFSLTLFIFIILPSSALALDPGENVIKCWDFEKTQNIHQYNQLNCEEVLKEWEKVEKRWLDKTSNKNMFSRIWNWFIQLFI